MAGTVRKATQLIVVGRNQLNDTHGVNEELRLEAALFAALRRLAKASGEAPKGLDRGGYWVLAKLATLAPIRLSDLSVALDLDPSTVSRHIKALWNAGLVGRESDPDDGRAALLSPTEAGHRSLEASRALRLRALADSMASWPQADRSRLVELLERLVDDSDRDAAGRTPAMAELS
jgi:DNA-binding MarR family transcriptional regulator